jgi:hypothetical protein
MEDYFSNWKNDMWESVIKQFQVQQNKEDLPLIKKLSIAKKRFHSEFEIELSDSLEPYKLEKMKKLKFELASKQFLTASTLEIISIKQLRRATKETSTYMIDFSLEDTGCFQYELN